ncbi:DUF5949 family protein [Streptomyces poonensis]|uniref:Uncharacterized protein n=1 Tax=Streptomyces poonensis TaxID=68255 RepID=A0A918UKW6_9ACTN|nr:DUF5949 family protein [Streptomyces poonensis]GGZ17868.1 hypothetical protein GCM10010365_42390 [Streptomyces poonensis]GLJ91020.1 hypothetical protein GCM10017589_36260 [Streptomyces poonensis]
MTSTPTEARPFRPGDLGTLVVMAWSGGTADGDMPYLLAYPLGDGENGPEASSAAVGQLLRDIGLPLGEETDAAGLPHLPVTLVLEAGQAVVAMPHFAARCPAPDEWLAAVTERGYAHLVFATRPWPEAAPGRSVEPEALAAFAGAPETLSSAAHVLLPARSPRS